MTNEEQTMDRSDLKQWLAIRKEAGLKIDPETAEVEWTYGNILDPYGVYPDFSDVCVGRVYFARSPTSKMWVEFGDLSDATRNALWEKHEWRLPLSFWPF